MNNDNTEPKPTQPEQPADEGLDGAACYASFLDALRRIYARGTTRISANCLADEMWPDARHNNSHGQVFNLAAGVAGRLLRKYRGCWEVENRVWEIVPEFIEHNAKHIHPESTPQDNE